MIREKAARLEKFCDHIVSCHVAVERPHKHEDSGSDYRVRVDVRIPPHHELVADKHAARGGPCDTLEGVVREAFHAMERQVKELAERQRGGKREDPDAGQTGVVTTINKEKRFGIIKTNDGRDIYFNEGAVLHHDFDRIEPGTSVRYVDGPGDEGPRASTVQVLDKRGQPIVTPGPLDPNAPRA